MTLIIHDSPLLIAIIRMYNLRRNDDLIIEELSMSIV